MSVLIKGFPFVIWDGLDATISWAFVPRKVEYLSRQMN
jgi:hypothetical protein